jgi:hypothetical protein
MNEEPRMIRLYKQGNFPLEWRTVDAKWLAIETCDIKTDDWPDHWSDGNYVGMLGLCHILKNVEYEKVAIFTVDEPDVSPA